MIAVDLNRHGQIFPHAFGKHQASAAHREVGAGDAQILEHSRDLGVREAAEMVGEQADAR
jgi:hypothetical protein